MALKLCARNTSVGADGIEFLERRADGGLFLRLFNADGSEAELSGNGTRCVAAWLAFSEQKNEVVLGTLGGERACKVIRSQGANFLIESEMGVPQVKARTLEIPGVGAIEGVEVNVGNPHFVLFVESEDFSAHGMSWQELGGIICTSSLFPQGTNVEFVRVRGKDEIAFRIYERGCGPTTSSGTGTCASSTAAIALRGCDGALTAYAEGGAQSVVWAAADEPMRLTGPAEIVCVGKVAAL
jgi:diaminopimelate epimerase